MRQANILSSRQQAEVLEYVSRPGNPHRLRDKVMVLLSLGCGLRSAEIAGIEWRDVTNSSDEFATRLQIRADVGKGHKARIVPLPPDLVAALKAWRASTSHPKPRHPIVPRVGRRAGAALTANAVAIWFRDLYTHLGYTGCSSHSGRRSFLTGLDAKGVSVFAIQKIAGHSNISTTARYIQSDIDAAFPAIAAMAAERRTNGG